MNAPTPHDHAESAPGRLEQIEARLAAATEGPWAIWEDLTDGGFIHVGDLDGVIPEGQMATEDGIEVNPTAKVYTDEDADLIAHAPTDLAALLAVVKAVRDLRDRVATAPFEALTRDSMTRSLNAALHTLEDES